MPLLAGAVCLLGLACGSSTPLAPIPDPGGPFHTNVPPNTSLGALTDDQRQELCGEMAAAEQTYSNPAILGEQTCRQIALEAYPVSVATDGGFGLYDAGTRDGDADGGSFLSVCQAAYDHCKQTSDNSPGSCALPTPFSCSATVELLSACYNEIANANPVAACVTAPTCAEAVASGTFRHGGYDASLAACPGHTGGPALPACLRLDQQCPGAVFYPSPP